MKRLLSVFFLVALSVLVLRSPSIGADPAEFYGNNVTVAVVPYGAGGGVDFAARLFASYWSDVTGGSMIVKNRTGGGGLVGTNFAYNADPDGKTIGTGILGATVLAPALLKEPGVQFDVTKMQWIGLIVPGRFGVAVGANSPYKTLADLRKAKGIKFASTGAKDLTTLGAALAIDLLGLEDAKIIPGYRGGNAAALSVAKGETDAYVIQDDALYGAVKRGFVLPSLVTLDFSKSEWFPDAPTVTQVAKLTPEQDKLLKIFASFNAGKIFFAQPGVPADKLAFLREAFGKIVSSSGFLRQAKLQWPIWEAPLTGEAIQAEVDKVSQFSSEDVNRFRQLVERYSK